MVRLKFHKEQNLTLRIKSDGNVMMSNGGVFRQTYATLNHTLRRLNLEYKDFK